MSVVGNPCRISPLKGLRVQAAWAIIETNGAATIVKDGATDGLRGLLVLKFTSEPTQITQMSESLPCYFLKSQTKHNSAVNWPLLVMLGLEADTRFRKPGGSNL